MALRNKVYSIIILQKIMGKCKGQTGESVGVRNEGGCSILRDNRDITENLFCQTRVFNGASVLDTKNTSVSLVLRQADENWIFIL